VADLSEVTHARPAGVCKSHARAPRRICHDGARRVAISLRNLLSVTKYTLTIMELRAQQSD
jgi:hypothetical protein